MSDSNSLKITGKAELPEGLKMSETYKMTTEIDIVSVEKRDMEDGSYEYVHKGKISSHIEIEGTGIKIKSKDPSRNSQKLRKYLYFLDVDYEKFMPWLMASGELDNLITKYKQR